MLKLQPMKKIYRRSRCHSERQRASLLQKLSRLLKSAPSINDERDLMTDTKLTTVALSALPPLGGELDGGVFIGLTTAKDGKHYAVALLADKPEGDLTWETATAWAESVGGVLPTRPVAALAFATAKDQFEPVWYWTADEYDGSYAWCQSFGNGYQDNNHKDDGLRARAVRLIQLTA